MTSTLSRAVQRQLDIFDDDRLDVDTALDARARLQALSAPLLATYMATR